MYLSVTHRLGKLSRVPLELVEEVVDVEQPGRVRVGLGRVDQVSPVPGQHRHEESQESLAERLERERGRGGNKYVSTRY